MHSLEGLSKVGGVANTLDSVLSLPTIVLLSQKLPQGCEKLVQKYFGSKSAARTYLQKDLFRANQIM